jgi:chromosome segregation ATPase
MSIRLSRPKTKKLEKNVQILKNKIETMNNNIQNLMVELDRLKNSWRRISQECSSLQINCHQHNTTINELKSKQDKSEQDLIKIKKDMEDLHFATYDGSIIWIIEEFKKKFGK